MNTEFEMNRPIAYFSVEGMKPFDASDPEWSRVREVVVYNRLDKAAKEMVATALKNHVSVRAMSPEALESLDQFITGGNN